MAIKTYCYKGECKVVRTGFHLENYPVCTVCKEEISETMYEHYKTKAEALALDEQLTLLDLIEHD